MSITVNLVGYFLFVVTVPSLFYDDLRCLISNLGLETTLGRLKASETPLYWPTVANMPYACQNSSGLAGQLLP